MIERVTPQLLLEKKQKKEKIIMLTAYDAAFSRLLEEVEVDIILVGDSAGNVILGYEDTLKVSMEEMIILTRAVSRVSKKSLIVADMPFGSYQTSIQEAVKNAIRFVKEAGAHAVKIESSKEHTELVRKINQAGIPVMTHIGLLPQQVLNIGGYKVKGKTFESAKELLETAFQLEKAGSFCMVLECVPQMLAKLITESLKIPTIGIGSGKFCDGQVLVTHDLLGFYSKKTPRFVRKYRDWAQDFKSAVKEFIDDVKKEEFPSEKESFKIDPEVIEKLKREGFNEEKEI